MSEITSFETWYDPELTLAKEWELLADREHCDLDRNRKECEKRVLNAWMKYVLTFLEIDIHQSGAEIRDQLYKGIKNKNTGKGMQYALNCLQCISTPAILQEIIFGDLVPGDIPHEQLATGVDAGAGSGILTAALYAQMKRNGIESGELVMMDQEKSSLSEAERVMNQLVEGTNYKVTKIIGDLTKPETYASLSDKHVVTIVSETISHGSLAYDPGKEDFIPVSRAVDLAYPIYCNLATRPRLAEKMSEGQLTLSDVAMLCGGDKEMARALVKGERDSIELSPKSITKKLAKQDPFPDVLKHLRSTIDNLDTRVKDQSLALWPNPISGKFSHSQDFVTIDMNHNENPDVMYIQDIASIYGSRYQAPFDGIIDSTLKRFPIHPIKDTKRFIYAEDEAEAILTTLTRQKPALAQIQKSEPKSKTKAETQRDPELQATIDHLEKWYDPEKPLSEEWRLLSDPEATNWEKDPQECDRRIMNAWFKYTLEYLSLNYKDEPEVLLTSLERAHNQLTKGSNNSFSLGLQCLECVSTPAILREIIFGNFDTTQLQEGQVPLGLDAGSGSGILTPAIYTCMKRNGIDSGTIYMVDQSEEPLALATKTAQTAIDDKNFEIVPIKKDLNHPEAYECLNNGQLVVAVSETISLDNLAYDPQTKEFQPISIEADLWQLLNESLRKRAPQLSAKIKSGKHSKSDIRAICNGNEKITNAVWSGDYSELTHEDLPHIGYMRNRDPYHSVVTNLRDAYGQGDSDFDEAVEGKAVFFWPNALSGELQLTPSEVKIQMPHSDSHGHLHLNQLEAIFRSEHGSPFADTGSPWKRFPATAEEMRGREFAYGSQEVCAHILQEFRDPSLSVAENKTVEQTEALDEGKEKFEVWYDPETTLQEEVLKLCDPEQISLQGKENREVAEKAILNLWIKYVAVSLGIETKGKPASYILEQLADKMPHALDLENPAHYGFKCVYCISTPALLQEIIFAQIKPSETDEEQSPIATDLGTGTGILALGQYIQMQRNNIDRGEIYIVDNSKASLDLAQSTLQEAIGTSDIAIHQIEGDLTEAKTYEFLRHGRLVSVASETISTGTLAYNKSTGEFIPIPDVVDEVVAQMSTKFANQTLGDDLREMGMDIDELRPLFAGAEHLLDEVLATKTGNEIEAGMNVTDIANMMDPFHEVITHLRRIEQEKGSDFDQEIKAGRLALWPDLIRDKLQLTRKSVRLAIETSNSPNHRPLEAVPDVFGDRYASPFHRIGLDSKRWKGELGGLDPRLFIYDEAFWEQQKISE